MRKSLSFLAALAVTFAAYIPTGEAVDLGATVTWKNPTVDTNGQPLTGSNAITKIQVFIAPSSILDDSTVAPFAELVVGAAPAPGTQLVYRAPAGSMVFARVKACNANGCAKFSMQASRLAPFPPAVPDVATDVQIVISANLNGGTLSITG